MNNSKIFKMTLAAIFCAIIFLVTAFVPIKLPLFSQGYFNLGDCFILIAALSISGIWGGLAGGIGSALADLLLGFGIYAPATFFIKLLMGICAYYLFKALKGLNLKSDICLVLICAIAAELIMLVGYLLFETAIYGFPAAVANLLGNATQGICNIVCGTLLFTLIKKIGLFSKIL